MKKTLLLGLGILMAGSMYAQNGTEPTELKHLFFIRVSPNGQYAGSYGSVNDVYEISTGNTTQYTLGMGLGNSLADNGMIVGSFEDDKGALGINGKSFTPKDIENVPFSALFGITPDGSRAVGIITNTEKGAMYLPYYMDLDEDGNVLDLQFLPAPTYDPFGLYVQYASAVWISEDGKTVVGMVVDNRGFLSYPIVYKQNGPVGENGKPGWNYYLPTGAEMADIPVIDNPYENEPPYPNATDYMDEDSKIIYDEEYENWVMGTGMWPNPIDFMTAQQEAAYNKAIATYEDWLEENDEKLEAYLQEYHQLLRNIPSFTDNSEIALKLDGTKAAYAQAKYDAEYNTMRTIWVFDIADPENITRELISSETDKLFARQILPNGTIIACTPRGGDREKIEPANSYIKTPIDSKFVPVTTYLQQTNPSYADWINTTFPMGSGLLSSNAEMDTFVFGAGIENVTDQVVETDFMYFSYIFTGVNGYNGIESAIADSDNGLYKVYNLQGVNVMTTENKADLNNLDKGLYIINGKKTVISK